MLRKLQDGKEKTKDLQVTVERSRVQLNLT